MSKKKIVVARCPRCGSTEVGTDESRSMIELSYMHCSACGHGELVDCYERDEDWITEIELPEEQSGIPSHVEPRRRGPSQRSASSADPDATPTRDESHGCASCVHAEAAAAYDHLLASRAERLVDESHFDVSLARCSCGQHFALVFLERIDWVGGEDDQTWLAVALSASEVAELRGTPVSEIESRLHALAWGRRFLARFFPTRGEPSIGWRESGFAIGPHD
jgi:hypothetical protein